MDDHQTIAVDMQTSMAALTIDVPFAAALLATTINVNLGTPLAGTMFEIAVPQDMHDVQVSLTASLDFSSPSGTTAGLVIGIP
jgi:hypothetical protein